MEARKHGKTRHDTSSSTNRRLGSRTTELELPEPLPESRRHSVQRKALPALIEITFTKFSVGLLESSFKALPLKPYTYFSYVYIIWKFFLSSTTSRCSAYSLAILALTLPKLQTPQDLLRVLTHEIARFAAKESFGLRYRWNQLIKCPCDTIYLARFVHKNTRKDTMKKEGRRQNR